MCIEIIDNLLILLNLGNINSALYPRVVFIIKCILASEFKVDNLKYVCTFLMCTLPENDLTEFTATELASPQMLWKAHILDSGADHIKIRNLLLEMLCQLTELFGGERKFINQLTKAIHHRWTLMFMKNGLHPFTIILATKFYAQLWMTTHSSFYGNKIKNNLHAVSVFLSESANLPQIYPIILSLSFGIKGSISFDMAFDAATMMAMFHTKHGTHFPEVLRVFTSMIRKLIESDSKKISLEMFEMISACIQMLEAYYKTSDEIKETLSTSEFIEDLLDLLHYISLSANSRSVSFSYMKSIYGSSTKAGHELNEPNHKRIYIQQIKLDSNSNSIASSCIKFKFNRTFVEHSISRCQM